MSPTPVEIAEFADRPDSVLIGDHRFAAAVERTARRMAGGRPLPGRGRRDARMSRLAAHCPCLSGHIAEPLQQAFQLTNVSLLERSDVVLMEPPQLPPTVSTPNPTQAPLTVAQQTLVGDPSGELPASRAANERRGMPSDPQVGAVIPASVPSHDGGELGRRYRQPAGTVLPDPQREGSTGPAGEDVLEAMVQADELEAVVAAKSAEAVARPHTSLTGL
jgi:hypothetical protein